MGDVKWDDLKAERERAVFLEFAGIAGLPLISGSVRSRCPPEPDIVCEIYDEGAVAFELVGIEDEGLTRAAAIASQKGSGPAVWFADPTLEQVKKKCRAKRYETPHPVELLVRGGQTMDPKDVWMPKFAQPVADLVEGSPFRRVWVVNFGDTAATPRGVWLVAPPPAWWTAA